MKNKDSILFEKILVKSSLTAMIELSLSYWGINMKTFSTTFCAIFGLATIFAAPVYSGDYVFSGIDTADVAPASGKMVFEPKQVLEPNVTSPRLQWGFDTEARYDSNILLAPRGQEVDGFTYSFSPDFLYRIVGDEFTEHMLVAGYGANFYYDDFSTDLNVNQDANLLYRFNSARTTATLSGNFTHVEGNNGRDFSKSGEALFLREQRRQRSDSYDVRFAIDYAVTSLIDLDFKSGYTSTNFSTLNDYSAYGAEFALLYGGRDSITRFGPYVGYERVEGDATPTQDAWQAGGRVDWRYSALTNFFGQVGVDNRTFEGPGVAGSTENVAWAVGARWAPDEMLSTSLTYDRSVAPSISSAGQNFVISTLSGAVRKDFLEHYFGRVVGSYSWADYSATTVAAATNREDNYCSVYAEVGRELADYGELSVFYNFIENDSNIAPFSFENQTVGVKLGIDF